MTASEQTPQMLVEENQKLVHALAKKIHSRLPHHIRFEDVLSYGQLGLTQAARTYRHNEDSSFSTFAYYRIRGAIYDGLTKMSWTSRAAYQKIKAEQMAAEVLQDSNADGATGDLNSEAKWLAETSERLAVVYLTSGLAADEQTEMAIEDDREVSPDVFVENEELHSILRSMVDKLPELEGKLIHMTYFENMSLAEAAKALGHSRSWGCRTHAKILDQMARQFQAMGVS